MITTRKTAVRRILQSTESGRRDSSIQDPIPVKRPHIPLFARPTPQSPVRVHATGGLIQKHDARVAYQRDAHGELALLSTRQRLCPLVFLFGQTHIQQSFLRALQIIGRETQRNEGGREGEGRMRERASKWNNMIWQS